MDQICVRLWKVLKDSGENMAKWISKKTWDKLKRVTQQLKRRAVAALYLSAQALLPYPRLMKTNNREVYFGPRITHMKGCLCAEYTGILGGNPNILYEVEEKNTVFSWTQEHESVCLKLFSKNLLNKKIWRQPLSTGRKQKALNIILWI